MGHTARATENRAFSRDEVYYRTRAAGPDAQEHALLIVNISAHGLMARCDLPYAVGERLRITLPVVGTVAAEIRWSLGGRTGCEFATPIDLPAYYALLAGLTRGG